MPSFYLIWFEDTALITLNHVLKGSSDSGWATHLQRSSLAEQLELELRAIDSFYFAHQTHRRIVHFLFDVRNRHEHWCLSEHCEGSGKANHPKCPFHIKYPLTRHTQKSEIGRNTFQPNRISWS